MEFLLTVASVIVPAPVLAFISYRFNVLGVVRKTYFFWAVCSLMNLGLFLPFVFPPLFFGETKLPKFLPFIAPPLLYATALTLALALVVRLSRPRVAREWLFKEVWPYAVNAFFLIALTVSAQIRQDSLIAEALKNRKPDCVSSRPFLVSLARAGDRPQFYEHAMFEENGRKFYWSYSELSFYEGNERLDRNFTCIEHRKL